MDYYPSRIEHDEWGHPSFQLHSPGGCVREFRLQVPGDHNVSNAIAAAALADLLGIDSAVTAKALLGFLGTDRRFEYKGKIGGVTIIDDYAHHPTEITATLKAAENIPTTPSGAFFSPTPIPAPGPFKGLCTGLCLADKVVLADIYAARETDTLGISSDTLKKGIEALGHECFYFPSFDEIEIFFWKIAQPETC